MMKIILRAIVLIALMSLSGSAASETLGPPPLPRHRLTYENLLTARYNSFGSEEIPALRYRLRLYNKTGPMWDDAHFGIGFQPTVDLSQSRLGPSLIIKPIGFFMLTVGYYYTVWHGAFGGLRSYSSVRDEYFIPDDFSSEGKSYASTGHEAQIGAQLIAAIGPFIFSDNVNFYWTTMALRDGDTVYFQPRYDVLVENNGWFFTNDTDVGYITPFGLTAAARVAVVYAFYTDHGSVSGESDANLNVPTVRLGPLLSYVFFDEPLRAFNKPTLIFMTSWWLRHRYRTGENVNQGIPFVVLALKFEGDIWWRD